MTSEVPSALSLEAIDPPGAVPSRVESIDLLRGAVMVLMVLDHCRDFVGDMRIGPTDLATTTPALFLTRWVTHLCAPTFALLAGVGVALRGATRPRGEMARYLLIRGIWLIVLDLTWDNVFIFGVPQFLLGVVLWMLGWSMIVLAGLIYLPRAVVGAVAVAMIAGHNLLDGIDPGEGVSGLLWSFLHAPGMRTLPVGIPILLGYPLIPWAGVMAAGYAIGPLFSRPARVRVPVLLAMGIGSIAGFLVLRGLNVYGDPRPWSLQRDPLFTLLSFVNVTKQPPSLLFLLLTLGAAFLLLAALERGLGPIGAPLRLFGRVPLFFFLMQWPVERVLGVVCPRLDANNLPVVYVSWVVAVVLLYPICRWYHDRERRRRRRGPASPAGVAVLTGTGGSSIQG